MDEVFETSHAATDRLAAHRHREPYAALVLDGAYAEASLDGRFDCSPGVLTVHPPWHTHANEFGQSGAIVLNIPIGITDGLVSVRVPDAEALAALARKRPVEAGHAVLEETEIHAPSEPAQWLASLVALLSRESDEEIAALAQRCGVSPEHASRACRKWFGMGPSALRREGRLRRAMSLLRHGVAPSRAAIEAGFSDQPHLTRLLKRATGMTPARFAAA